MCTKCNGTGWLKFSDPVDYWGATISMESSEFCDACICANKCPVCGEELTCPDDAEVITCELCGYNSESNCEEIEPEEVKNIVPYFGAINSNIDDMKEFGRGFALYQDVVIPEGAAWIVGVSDQPGAMPVIMKGGKLFTTVEFSKITACKN